MGYNTCFELFGFESESDFLKHKNMDDGKLERIFDWIKNNKINGMEYEYLDDAKWYHWEEDMIDLSKAYPDIIFELYGDGDDSEDVWKSVFYNGKHEHVAQRSYFPAINISKLGISDPDDCEAPEPMPENAYFFAKE